MSDQSQSNPGIPQDLAQKYDEELVNPPPASESAPVTASELKAGAADRAIKGTRQAYDPASGGLAAWPVYDRYALAPGAVVKGPALIEEHESTCVIGAGDAVTVDSHFNLIAELSA